MLLSLMPRGDKVQRIRVKIIHDNGAYRVDLPDYTIVEGSYLPLTGDSVRADGISNKASVSAVLALNTTVEVDIPDRIANEAGTGIDRAKMVELYEGQLRWGEPSVELNI